MRIDLDRRLGGEPVPVPYVGSSVTADELGGASREISATLDAYDTVKGRYVLEVSTPGLDRPLSTAQDFVDFVGHEVKVVLAEQRDGRRKLKGTNRGVRDEEGVPVAVIEEDGVERVVPLADIRCANLVVGLAGFGSGPARPTRRRK